MNPEQWVGRIFVGEWELAADTIDVIEPATGEILGSVGAARPDDVTRAATRAAQSQRDWAATSYEERARILRDAGRLWEEHATDVATWLIREGGGTAAKAAKEVSAAAEECYEAAGLAARPWGEVLRTRLPRLSISRRNPVGVVGVISPYNFPLALAIRSVAPALALGNAVLVKPDPRTAVSGGISIAQVFEEAGLPAGVLHVLPGGADVGTAVVADPHVRVVAFTGSTDVGRQIGELAARTFTRVHLELGGNAAQIVFDDAGLDLAVGAGAFGAFRHQGQVCMATGRHLVQRGIYDEYVERLTSLADGLTTGDPWTGSPDLGPLIDARQRDRVHGLVMSSASSGAQIRCGGVYDELYYRPTVLAGVDPTTPAFAEEVFGPVAPVLAFDDVDQAVAITRASPYALSLGVLTSDPERAQQVADRIPAGMVHVNDQPVNDEPVAPFGGIAASGSGSRFGGVNNLDAYTDIQWLTYSHSIPRRAAGSGQ